MFVPHARVRIVGLREHTERRRRRVVRRRINFIELLRMPCLLPTLCAIVVGIIVMASGCVMSIMGYKSEIVSVSRPTHNNTAINTLEHDTKYYAFKVMSYLGPMLMGIGLFVIIVASVLYCEIMDKYANIVPNKNSRKVGKKKLHKMIMEQFRKNYFRGIEVPLQKPHPILRSSSMNKTLFKALSISTPAMLATPELTSPWKTRHKSLVQEQNCKKSVKLKLIEWEERWLKTSSLPNIRPLESESTEIEMSSDTGITGREEYLKTKRMSKSCGNVPQMFASSEAFSDITSSGLDNPAYLPDAEKDKLLKPRIRKLPENYQSCECVKDPLNVQRVSVIVHKASIHDPPRIFDIQKKGVRAIKSFDQETFMKNKLLDVKQTDKCKSCLGLVNGDRFHSDKSSNDNLKCANNGGKTNSADSLSLAGDMLRIFDLADMAQV